MKDSPENLVQQRASSGVVFVEVDANYNQMFPHLFKQGSSSEFSRVN